MTAPSRENLAGREAEIKALVEGDKREEARKLLFDLIVSCAQGGDVKNATRLRDWFYEVDPMALSDIIKVNEIIDESMSGLINEQFVQAWTGLKKVLSEEEFTSLYHCLEEHQVEEGKQIVKAGSKLDAIFFVTRGNVNVNCNCIDKNITVKVLESGTLIGENCFEPSCWTVSLTSASPVTLSILRHKKLMELYDRFPGFEAKMAGYYEKFNDTRKLLKDQGLNRRRFERFSVDHKITFQTIDKDGKAGERSFRGELDNISGGGLSFFLRIVKRENRRMLFGRRLLVTVKQNEKKLEFTGTVAAITIHDFQDHDYSVHVSFDKQVPEDSITPLAQPVHEEQQWIIPEETPEMEDNSGTQDKNNGG